MLWPSSCGSSVLALVVLAALCVAPDARADGVASCLADAERAQQLRDEGKLLDARQLLLRCAADACPKVVQKDCGRWLEEVSSNLPSLVLSAKDANGQDVLDVRVTEDGRMIVEKLDGTAVFVNPGPHTFRFELPNHETVEQSVIVREGEKHRPVNVSFGGARAFRSRVAQDAPADRRSRAAHEGAAHEGAADDASVSKASGDGTRTAGLVVGGIGVVALGVGAYFGLRALGKRSDSDEQCTNGRCTTAGVSLNDQAISSAWIADVGIGLGLVGVGVGTYLLLRGPTPSPRATAPTSARLRILPAAAPTSAGLTMIGSF